MEISFENLFDNKLPTDQEILLESIHYDSLTGKFSYAEQNVSWFELLDLLNIMGFKLIKED